MFVLTILQQKSYVFVLIQTSRGLYHNINTIEYIMPCMCKHIARSDKTHGGGRGLKQNVHRGSHVKTALRRRARMRIELITPLHLIYSYILVLCYCVWPTSDLISASTAISWKKTLFCVGFVYEITNLILKVITSKSSNCFLL